MSYCNIPVSIGELWDKYTILLIKNEQIKDINKLKYINNEIKQLEPFLKKYNLNIEIQEELKDCNQKLWNIENFIREKERQKSFDDEFIQLARSVYVTNDLRCKIKTKINEIFNSKIFEVKSYSKYN